MEDNRLSPNQLKKWQQRRFTTFLIFCAQYFVNGISYSMFVNTSWIYVVDQLKPPNVGLVYSVMMHVRYLPCIIFSLSITKLYDKYRRTCLFMSFINMICLLGASFYIISFSVYLPTVGSFLLGFAYFGQPVTVGELARSYPPDELTYRIPVMNFCYIFATLPASLILYLTKNLNFSFEEIHIEYGNFIGVVLIICFTVLQILTVSFVHDLSREFDLKEHILSEALINVEHMENEEVIQESHDHLDEEANGESNQLIKGCEVNSNNLSILNNLKRVFGNPDVVLLLFLVLLFYFSVVVILAYIPLLLEAKLKYGVQVFNNFYLTYSIMLAMLLPVFIIFKINSKQAYFLGVLAFLMVIAIGICLKIMDLGLKRFYNLSLLYLIAVLLALVLAAEDVFLTCTIAKFVKPDIQSFADGVRLIFMQIGQGLGGLSVVLFSKNQDTFSAILLAVFIISILMTYTRKTAMMNPTAVA